MKRYQPLIRLGVVSLAFGGVLAAAALGPAARGGGDRGGRREQWFPNASGVSANFSANGPIDTNNPFFLSLGTNGRACVTCHQPDDGWTITPKRLRQRFDKTRGLDPVFRPVDGSNSPEADVSTVDARRRAYTMLLTKGLIRVGIGIPAGAEFTLESVDDPYNYASAREMSLFRRPLPSCNLPFLTATMWDGRESKPGSVVGDDLASQAANATLGHAQAAHAPTPEQVRQIVAFETGQYSAQRYDDDAGLLTDHSGRGGARYLAEEEFFVGINDPLGGNPTGAAFDPKAMALYRRWADLHGGGSDGRNAARRAVARGEALFNTRQFVVKGVGGLNDALNLPDGLTATCTTCHDAPNVGNHSVRLPLNIGLADASRRTPDLPLYTLRNIATGEIVQTTDPGRALITGKWADIGKFKGPILRNLAARAPYFHNGSAATLEEAVDFYDTRFAIGLTRQEKKDLAAFLKTL
jgi:cytochrome c peroxidase